MNRGRRRKPTSIIVYLLVCLYKNIFFVVSEWIFSDLWIASL